MISSGKSQKLTLQDFRHVQLHSAAKSNSNRSQQWSYVSIAEVLKNGYSRKNRSVPKTLDHKVMMVKEHWKVGTVGQRLIDKYGYRLLKYTNKNKYKNLKKYRKKYIEKQILRTELGNLRISTREKTHQSRGTIRGYEVLNLNL